VIGASRSTVVNTLVNNIGSITITGTIINCNTPVDNNGNILGRYASSQSIIRINTTKLMYVSTTIGYNSVGSNNDMMITCSSGTQHKDYVPMGITYTDRIGSESSATLNIGSDKNIINNGVYVRPSSCANGSRSSNAICALALTTTLTDTNNSIIRGYNHQQQTGNTDDVISNTGRDNEDGERGSTRIPDVNVHTIVLSSTTSTFEELMNDDIAPTTKNYIGVMIIINIEITGSICLVDLRLRRKSHGLWRTTRTYQWKYSWYKLDGRGVTGFSAADRIRIWRYASQLVLVS